MPLESHGVLMAGSIRFHIKYKAKCNCRAKYCSYATSTGDIFTFPTRRTIVPHFENRYRLRTKDGQNELPPSWNMVVPS